MTKKYSYKDDFEKLYLRYDYLVRMKEYDPQWIRDFKKIVDITSNKVYNKLKPNFDMVGFDLEDLHSIANIYMVYYMSLYSLKTNKKIRKRFEDKFIAQKGRKPTKKEISRVERNNLITFLNQKLNHCAVVCERKSRNVKVGKEKRRIIAETANSKPVSDEILVDEYKKFGYRKVTQKEFKEIQKKCKIKRLPELIDNNGYKVRKIQILSSGIDKKEYELIMNNYYHNTYNEGPENMIVDYEEEKEIEVNKNYFNSLDSEKKIKKLRLFIHKNKNSKYLKNEIKTAKKMIKELKNMV